jgi:hypothetical protein
MSSTYLNACFDGPILLELEATTAESKTQKIHHFLSLIHSHENSYNEN